MDRFSVFGYHSYRMDPCSHYHSTFKSYSADHCYNHQQQWSQVVPHWKNKRSVALFWHSSLQFRQSFHLSTLCSYRPFKWMGQPRGIPSSQHLCWIASASSNLASITALSSLVIHTFPYFSTYPAVSTWFGSSWLAPSYVTWNFLSLYSLIDNSRCCYGLFLSVIKLINLNFILYLLIWYIA